MRKKPTAPLPPRESMLEVADYLEALVPSSGTIARGALTAIASTLRERAHEAPTRQEVSA